MTKVLNETFGEPLKKLNWETVNTMREMITTAYNDEDVHMAYSLEASRELAAETASMSEITTESIVPKDEVSAFADVSSPLIPVE